MSEQQEFNRGDRVCARNDMQQSWRIGIITDVFVAPVTGKIVYVIGGDGYYAHEVTTDIERLERDAQERKLWDVAPEPQSLRVTP